MGKRVMDYGDMDDINFRYTYDGMGRRLSETTSDEGQTLQSFTSYDSAFNIIFQKFLS